MTVLHVVEPFAAGVAVFVRSLTESMPDDVHIIVHGERSHVMSAAEVKRSFPQKNVRFIRWHSASRSINPVKDLLALGELYKIIRRLKRKNMIDAVHLHSSKGGLLGRAACRMANIDNVVYTPNGAPFLSSGSGFANYMYTQLERFANRLGGKVICCSESELNEYKKIGIDAEYVNNGIAVGKQVSDVPMRSDNKFRIITSGRIVAQKNPGLFNDIAAYFEEFDQFEFVWIGDGPARQLLTGGNIRVTGWLGSEEVKSEMTRSDVYLSTSLYEGLSFAVLEALAMQKPVLLSDCVGNTDLIQCGLNGDMFRTKMEAITKILKYSNNQDMLSVMGQFSKELCVSKFDVNQNFLKYKNIYLGQPALS
jgi:glycosyltransferase involved in cell wall biosynthesis